MVQQLSTITTRVTPIVLVMKIVVLSIFFDTAYLFLTILSDYLQGQVFQLVDFDVFIYLGLFLLQTGISVYLLIKWHNEYYFVEQAHVIHKSGIIVKTERRYSLINAESINYIKGFWGRVLGYGDIEIQYPNDKDNFRMRSISNPEQFIYLMENRKV